MKAPKFAIQLDTRYETKYTDAYRVVLYIYFQGKKLLLGTGLNHPQHIWDTISRKNPPGEYLADKEKIRDLEDKARTIVETLGENFTLAAFKAKWEEKEKKHTSTVRDAFQAYIDVLRENDQIGTAITYEGAMNKIEQYAPGILLKEITKDWLEKFEKDMKKGIPARKINKLSVTSIGYYLRNLKKIINIATYETNILTEKDYPFKTKKNPNGYVIPAGTADKEALNPEEMQKLVNYQPKEGSAQEEAKNWLLFMYLSNGMNPKDICRLKWSQVKENKFTFIRAKTERTTKGKPVIITVILTDLHRKMFAKYGTKKQGDNYVFSLLKEGITAAQERNLVQDFTKRINRGAKKIVSAIGITKKITCYVMRHTNTTRSIKQGVNPMLISKNLGHKDFKTTQNYIGGFDDQELQDASNKLLDF